MDGDDTARPADAKGSYTAHRIAKAIKNGDQVNFKKGLADILLGKTEPGSPPRHAPIVPEVSTKPERPILSRRDIFKNLYQRAPKECFGAINLPLR